MSIPRYQQSQLKTLRPKNKTIAITGMSNELTARSVEVQGGLSRSSARNYTKPETSSRSLLARPVKVGLAASVSRLPDPEVVEDLKLKQALMLLQPGAKKEHTEKALEILEFHLRSSNRAPELRNELYKAAELIFEGKMESENNLAAASKLIYLAERFDGWRESGRLTEFDKPKHEFVGRVYSEIEKQGKKKLLFDEQIDVDTKSVYRLCESVYQEPMLSKAYFTSINDSQSIDEMQNNIEWAFQCFFIYSETYDRAIYFNKINNSIRDGSITHDQLIHHFELIKHAIDLGFLKTENTHALNDLLGLGDTVKALFVAGNIEMALFALGSHLVPMEAKDFNPHHYKELLGIVEESLVLVLEKGDGESAVLLCDKLKYLSEMTHSIDLDRYSYGRHIAVLKNIEKLIDSQLKNDQNNEYLIKAKLKLLSSEINFCTEKGKQMEYVTERNIEDLNRFYDKSSLKDPELLFKKLQWAVDEGLVFFSDVFEERAEDLLYGRGMEVPEPEMAAKFFVHAAGSKVGTPLIGLRRAITEMRASSVDEETIKDYEKQFGELVVLQQSTLSQLSRAQAQEILDLADNQMGEGDLLGASINYLLLIKSNLASPFNIFGIGSENKRVREQVAKLADRFSKSNIDPDRLWGQQLRVLVNR